MTDQVARGTCKCPNCGTVFTQFMGMDIVVDDSLPPDTIEASYPDGSARRFVVPAKPVLAEEFDVDHPGVTIANLVLRHLSKTGESDG